MIVTVDRDSQNDFTDLLFELRLRYLCKSPDNCRVWKTNKGYHVALRINGLDFEKALFLRAYLLDDFYRLGYDLARTDGLGPGAMTGVIFDAKGGAERSRARELELYPRRRRRQYFLKLRELLYEPDLGLGVEAEVY